MKKKLIFSNGEDVDLQLKSAIEGVVIKWVTQITEVLQETPSSVHKSLENPLPYAGKYSTSYGFLVSSYIIIFQRQTGFNKMFFCREKYLC